VTNICCRADTRRALLRLRLDAVSVHPVARFEQASVATALSRGEPQQPGILLRDRRAVREGERRENGGREEWPRHDGAPHLLDEQREVEELQAGSAVRLRHDEPRPAELGDLVVEGARIAVLALRHLTDELRRALALEQLPRRALQQFLILAETEIHRDPRQLSSSAPFAQRWRGRPGAS
jgi:hypothetical protein